MEEFLLELRKADLGSVLITPNFRHNKISLYFNTKDNIIDLIKFMEDKNGYSLYINNNKAEIYKRVCNCSQRDRMTCKKELEDC